MNLDPSAASIDRARRLWELRPRFREVLKSRLRETSAPGVRLLPDDGVGPWVEPLLLRDRAVLSRISHEVARAAWAAGVPARHRPWTAPRAKGRPEERERECRLAFPAPLTVAVLAFLCSDRAEVRVWQRVVSDLEPRVGTLGATDQASWALIIGPEERRRVREELPVSTAYEPGDRLADLARLKPREEAWPESTRSLLGARWLRGLRRRSARHLAHLADAGRLPAWAAWSGHDPVPAGLAAMAIEWWVISGRRADPPAALVAGCDDPGVREWLAGLMREEREGS